MKQKYVILKDDDSHSMLIKEFAELDKDTLTFVCESSYSQQEIQASIAAGTDAIVAVLRTPNFYPSDEYAKKIAEGIIAFFRNDALEPAEIIVDDAAPVPEEDLESDVEMTSEEQEMDDVVEDNLEEISGKAMVDGVMEPLKVAQDD